MKIFGMPADKLLHQLRLPKDLHQQLKTALTENKGFETEPFEATVSNELEKRFIQASIINPNKSFPYRILLNFKKIGERSAEK